MDAYSVYLFDYTSRKSEWIGRLWERRSMERMGNEKDMLRLAQKVYRKKCTSKNLQLFILRENRFGDTFLGKTPSLSTSLSTSG